MDGVAVWIGVALLALITISLPTVLYQLVRQQGRLLLRIDDLEHRLFHVEEATYPAASVERGLPVGSALPALRLPDLTGRMVDLDDLRGRRVLLTHWSTTCGYCEQIAPELAKLQTELRGHGVELVLVSYGDADANRRMAEAHGFDSTILLADGDEPAAVFEGFGTPVAYLIDERGDVAEPVAIGANDVPELARRAVAGRRRLARERPLAESRIERAGLKPGNRAPAFTLSDLRQQPVSLDDYRGRRVLLVFSDPDCGPCDVLGPDLAALHRSLANSELEIVMVSRGDPEENRHKSERFGFEFPVVLQDRWKLSKQYGIFETPVAFLIGEDGTIEQGVARGVAEILDLARMTTARSRNGRAAVR